MMEKIKTCVLSIKCVGLTDWTRLDEVLFDNVNHISELLLLENCDLSKVWKLYLHLVGSQLTNKTIRPFFNSLLKVMSAKKCFRNPAMKLCSLECWLLLICFFFRGLETNTPLPSTHSNLILKYFCNNDTAVEVVRNKVKVMWYFLCKLTASHPIFETALLRFFELFSYAPKTHAMLSLLPELGAEMLALMLGCHPDTTTTTLPLPPSTFVTPRSQHLLKVIHYYELVFKSLTLEPASERLINLLKLTWNKLLQVVSESNSGENINTLLKMVATCFETAVSSEDVTAIDTCVTLLVAGIISGPNPLPDSCVIFREILQRHGTR